MEKELAEKMAGAMANIALNVKALKEDLNIRLLRAEARIKELVIKTELQDKEIASLKKELVIYKEVVDGAEPEITGDITYSFEENREVCKGS